MRIKAVMFQLEGVLDQHLPQQVLQTQKVLSYLRGQGLPLGLLCSTIPDAVDQFFKESDWIDSGSFAVIAGPQASSGQRSHFHPLPQAADELDCKPDHVLFVAADKAGLAAADKVGFHTVLVGKDIETAGHESEFQIPQLKDLIAIARQGLPLPSGKLPNDLLREFLGQLVFEDASIIINPGVGEDIAAVDVGPEEVLVLKSDPITFATDSIGQYAVLVNANDIATAGATPRWMLTTLLLPCGTTPSEIKQIVMELKAFCGQWGITLCGGHTEITDAVTRTVIAGTMAGTVARENLIDKRNMQPGDRVLLTKAVAVEGTAIIAREFNQRLERSGMTKSEIYRCQGFLANISILKEAEIAAGYNETTAMHDVTEGGLATALAELSAAGMHKIRVEKDRIPIYPETEKICSLLGIHPLGLIGSGSLLICCSKNSSDHLMAAIKTKGIEVSCIGEVLGKGNGIEAIENRQAVTWPQFEVDEIATLF